MFCVNAYPVIVYGLQRTMELGVVCIPVGFRQIYSPEKRHNFLMTDSIVFYFYLADFHYIRPCGPAWRDYMLHYMFDSR